MKYLQYKAIFFKKLLFEIVRFIARIEDHYFHGFTHFFLKIPKTYTVKSEELSREQGAGGKGAEG
jgi:hypothetical protein